MNFPASKEKSSKLPPIPPATMKRGKLNLFHPIATHKPVLYNSSKLPKSFDEGSCKRFMTGQDSRFSRDNTNSASSSSTKLYRNLQTYEDHNRRSSATDQDLITLMSQQLHKADNQLDKVRQQLMTSEEKLAYKDSQISELNNKISKLEEQLAKEAEKKICPCTLNGMPYEKLLHKCKCLEKQLLDMQEFLADYGLTWVGEVGYDLDTEEEPKYTASISEVKSVDETMWNPDKSFVSSVQEVKFDYEQLLQNIKDLNAIAGEGEAQMCVTQNGATFKRTVQGVPLTIYSNGLLLYSGPFRPYSDPGTWLILQDIMDGYFPHELQKEYPDGVVFQVIDNRNTLYEDPTNKWKVFSGKGYRLGNKTSNQDLPVSKTSADV